MSPRSQGYDSMTSEWYWNKDVATRATQYTTNRPIDVTKKKNKKINSQHALFRKPKYFIFSVSMSEEWVNLGYGMRTGHSCQRRQLKKSNVDFKVHQILTLIKLSMCWTTCLLALLLILNDLHCSGHYGPSSMTFSCSHSPRRRPQIPSPVFDAFYSLFLNMSCTLSPHDFAYSLLCHLHLLCWNPPPQGLAWIPDALACVLLPWNPNVFFSRGWYLRAVYFCITSLCFSLVGNDCILLWI